MIIGFDKHPADSRADFMITIETLREQLFPMTISQLIVINGGDRAASDFGIKVWL
jgi:hypothetical protein